MKGSLIVIGVFLLGCLSGYAELCPESLKSLDIEKIVLYLLMLQVGMSVGSDKKLKEILRSIRPRLLLVPLATIAGSLLFTALASLAMGKWSLPDCLALGSGFGYYSLSSILIMQLKEPFVGAQLASELGAMALMANVLREMFALAGTPLFVRYFGKLGPICVAGATSMDTCLPVITRYCGKEMVFIAVFHGVLVDLSVPILVSFFCSL